MMTRRFFGALLGAAPAAGIAATTVKPTALLTRYRFCLRFEECPKQKTIERVLVFAKDFEAQGVFLRRAPAADGGRLMSAVDIILWKELPNDIIAKWFAEACDELLRRIAQRQFRRVPRVVHQGGSYGRFSEDIGIGSSMQVSYDLVPVEPHKTVWEKATPRTIVPSRTHDQDTTGDVKLNGFDLLRF
jgi:hypothetical protein